MTQTDNPILVTGAHRSGTTWVGKMLAAGKDVAYISEPLNVLHRPGVFNAPVQYWYTYICPENEYRYIHPYKETLQFNYKTWQEIKSLRSIHDALRMVRDWFAFRNGRINGLQPLLKDPFAVFSVPWFIQQFDCQVIITVRHPAAFTSSLKRLGWHFDFSNLLHQTYLMRDHLDKFRDEMFAMQDQNESVIASSCLLWRMIYQTVSAYQNDQIPVTVLRHEDISLDPITQFRELYEYLGLNYTPEIEDAIQKASGTHNPSELSNRSTHATRLDSRANIKNWKHRLTSEEIIRIRRLTEDIACLFYSEEDWN